MKHFVIVSILSLLMAFPSVAMGAGQAVKRTQKAQGTQQKAGVKKVQGKMGTKKTQGQARTTKMQGKTKANPKGQAHAIAISNKLNQTIDKKTKKERELELIRKRGLTAENINCAELGNLLNNSTIILQNGYVAHQAFTKEMNYGEGINTNKLAGILRGKPDLLTRCAPPETQGQLARESVSNPASYNNFIIDLATKGDRRKMCWVALQVGVLKPTPAKEDFCSQLQPTDVRNKDGSLSDGYIDHVLDFVDPRGATLCQAWINQRGEPVKGAPFVRYQEPITIYDSKGRPVQLPYKVFDVNIGAENGENTALRGAARNGHFAMVVDLVEIYGAKIRVPSDKRYASALDQAIFFEYEAQTEQREKARLDGVNAALDLQDEYLRVIAYLIKKDPAALNPEDGRVTPLMRVRSKRMLEWLYSKGAKLNAIENKTGFTVLMKISENLNNTKGKTPTTDAEMLEMAKFFVEHGGDITREVPVKDPKTGRTKYDPEGNALKVSALTLNENRPQTFNYIKQFFPQEEEPP